MDRDSCMQTSEHPVNSLSSDGDISYTERNTRFLFNFDMNFDVCNTCGQYAEKKLICCSSCPRSYHLTCAKLLRFPRGAWCCSICETRQTKCTICDCELSLSPDYRLVRCMSCTCLTHFDCVEVAQELLLRTPKYWYSKERLGNQPVDYMCYDCQKALGVERILDSYNFEEKKETALISNDYYFIKFKRMSYIHSVWVKGQDLKTYVSTKVVKKFEQHLRENVDEVLKGDLNGVRDEHLEVDRIIDKWIPNPEEADLTECRYLVKWRGLEYKNSTWERERDIAEYREEIKRFESLRLIEMQLQTGEISPESLLKKKIESADEFIKKGKLSDNQLAVFKWILESWNKKGGKILISKDSRIECLLLFQYLCLAGLSNGPFMICAESSEVNDWIKQCEAWFPEANLINYSGSQTSRELIKRKEIHFARIRNSNRENICKFNILITTYELLRGDKLALQKVKWNCLIIDAIQDKAINILQNFQAEFRLLMLDNELKRSLEELLNLLQFINPNGYSNKICESIIKRFEDNSLNNDNATDSNIQEQLNKKEQAINDLLKEILPHTLTKANEEIIPKLEELVIPVEMTKEQKEMYKSIFILNSFALKKLDKKDASMKSLRSIILMLELCANHGLLLNHNYNTRIPSSESYNSGMIDFSQQIITLSGKVKLLERILIELKQGNHKVLILSQTRTILDIIEEYLNSKPYKYVRISNVESTVDKQKLVSRFNEDPEIFVLLASKSVVSKADTVVIYDEKRREENSKRQDKQFVIRLITKDTVEEKLYKKNIDIETNSLEIVDNVLRYGIESLSKEEREYTIDDIKKVLNRSLSKEERNKVLFNWGNTNTYGGDDYWSRLFRDKWRIEVNKVQRLWGKRQHSEFDLNISASEEYKHPTSSDKRSEKTPSKRKKTEESLWNALDTESFDCMIPTESKTTQLQQASDIVKQLLNSDLNICPISFHNNKLVRSINNQSLLEFCQPNLTGPIDIYTSLSIILWGFHEINRRDFMAGFMKYGVTEHNWKELYDKCISEPNTSLNKRTLEEFTNYAQRFFTVINDFIQNQKYEAKTFFTGLYTVKQIILRAHHISLLRGIYRLYVSNPNSFVIDTKGTLLLNNIEYKQLVCGKWRNNDDFELIKGILIHGYGSFQKIITDPNLWNQEDAAVYNYQPWKIIFNKISEELYENEPKDTEYLMQSYVMNYLKLRLKFLLTELEKISTKIIPSP